MASVILIPPPQAHAMSHRSHQTASP